MHWIERLSEYQDGELAPSEREACEAHLAACADCRAALQEIQLVTTLARADEDVMPATDLWPGILARLQPNSHAAGTFRSAKRTRHISFTLPELALAASLLIAVSAGVAYVAAGRALAPPLAAADAPIQAVAEPMMPPSADLAPANFADAQFERAVADLERILVEQRDELDPGTVMVIERNLAAIDAAIREARTALDADPANQYLNSHLADARRRKIDLLRHAATLNSTGD
jgi:anti-sigma factor RsiW